MRVIWTSDPHLGLKTDDVDRTEEILGVLKRVITRAVKVKQSGERVVLVLGGDIFNSNVANESLINSFIMLLNLLFKYDIETYILVGNHDAISDPKRLSCMSFVHSLGKVYKNIKLVDDIAFIKYDTFDNGPLYFTFLPHISKATIAKNVMGGKLKKEIPTQEYIDSKCERILRKVGTGSQHMVFSHLNIKGAHGGSEENLLKKSEVYLPECFTNVPAGFIDPVILQGHIHSSSIEGNLHVVGSPIFCGFGESEEEKCYLEVKIAETLGKDYILNYISTGCLQFKQLEVDMISDSTPFLKRTDVLRFIKSLDENCVAKFDIVISPHENTYDWQAIREKVIKTTNVKHLKPIMPRVVLKRPVRSPDQKLGLDPDKSVRIFLKRNLGKEVDRMKRVYKRSQVYLKD